MKDAAPFRLGVVEGFFGRPWSWQARQDYAPFLAAQGCNSYVYAPKSDAWLRKQWQQPFPQPHLDALSELRGRYALHGVDFGIGFSPFELYKDFSARNRELLQMKLQQINAIDPDTLCILFDDMMGDLGDLASAQGAIMEFVRTHSSARRFAICPTYYSDDPLLTRHFGAQPERYLEDLGRKLAADIEIFWTGPKVISSCYPAAHLRDVAARLGRKPLLWDNYPVNDNKRLSSFLHLRPFTGRDAELRELCSGHLSNPMNQAYLSQLPLYALSAVYAQQPTTPEHLFGAACNALCPPDLAQALLQDAASFQAAGLDSFDVFLKERMLRKYASFNHPMAEEVCGWLRGEYAFDPACLT